MRKEAGLGSARALRSVATAFRKWEVFRADPKSDKAGEAARDALNLAENHWALLKSCDQRHASQAGMQAALQRLHRYKAMPLERRSVDFSGWFTVFFDRSPLGRTDERTFLEELERWALLEEREAAAAESAQAATAQQPSGPDAQQAHDLFWRAYYCEPGRSAPKWATDLAWQIHEVVGDPRAMSHFRRMVQAWAEERAAEFLRRRKWRDRHSAYLTKAVNHPRLTDHDAGAPQEGLEWIRLCGPTGEEVEAWGEAVLDADKEPKVLTHLAEGDAPISAKYAFVAGVHDHCTRGLGKIDPWADQAVLHRPVEGIAYGLLVAGAPGIATDEAMFRALFAEVSKAASGAAAARLGEEDAPRVADDEPDEQGFVRDPKDEKAYTPASQIMKRHWPVPPLRKVSNKHKELWRILDAHPEIWRWQPKSGKYKLRIHLGRWLEYTEAERRRLANGLAALAKEGHWICMKCSTVFVDRPGDDKCPECGADTITPVVPRPVK